MSRCLPVVVGIGAGDLDRGCLGCEARTVRWLRLNGSKILHTESQGGENGKNGEGGAHFV